MATDDTPVDIYIIGTGMVGYSQMTLEAQSVLEAAERIYLVHYQDTVYEYMEKHAETVELTEEYTEGEPRQNTYDRMAERVLEGAEETDGPVVFALYGHPIVFVSPTRWICERAPDRGLEVEVLPGVSSMDCLYADIALDPASHGIQMFGATDLLLRDHEIQPNMPAMVWQIGSVETVLYNTADNKPERFTRIREYLQEHYPDNHTVYLLQTATYPITESKQIGFELDEFEEMSDEVNDIQTLYIPPVEKPEVDNEELYEKLVSAKHLETITDTDAPAKDLHTQDENVVKSSAPMDQLTQE
jgi:uncharacterized protein YabN with tetrapyrrole methylase and pyrophosphatase domain